MPDSYWPPSAPHSTHISSFIKAFEIKRYTTCADGTHREGYEKIAIYEKNGQVTHAAKQIDNTKWTSKLGRSWDISHTAGAVSGGLYGVVTTYMERPIIVPSDEFEQEATKQKK